MVRKNRSGFLNLRVLLGSLVLVSVTAAVVGCSSFGGLPSTGGSSSTTAAQPTTWDGVVDAANKEGSVTIYSGQPVDNLNALAAAFQKEYPDIKVNVFRALDNETAAKIEAERDTNSPIADVVVQATLPFMVDKSKAGWFTAAELPAFDDPGYNKKLNLSADGDYFAVSAQVITFAWNTDLWPKGIKDWSDLLDPGLAGGKIGVLEPSVGANPVDFYLYLQEQYGEDFIDKLAAQKPQIYNSALPIGQAITSGEIAVGAYSLPLIQQKKDGAHVDWGFSPKLYGAVYNGAVLSNAAHPNAAKVLANFMLTADGQTAVAAAAASSLPDIPGTVGFTDDVRRQDLTKLTPEVVSDFQARFARLFQ